MPRLRSCKYCGRIHATDYDCGKKPRRSYKRKEEERGRYTTEWKHKSEEIKERSHYLCAVCLSEDILTYSGLEVHHIIKLSEQPELLLEDGNLICLCVRHHKQADRGEIEKSRLYELVKARDNPPGGGRA